MSLLEELRNIVSVASVRDKARRDKEVQEVVEQLVLECKERADDGQHKYTCFIPLRSEYVIDRVAVEMRRKGLTVSAFDGGMTLSWD